ncbi:hypothetical protein SDC9_153465 [bioreactor metagenome]|uniref:Uncharacterized protein n=1 Tax=bioreactor metagenome TaxID=1076179 RepID=A0A645EYF7_9ZZZZ
MLLQQSRRFLAHAFLFLIGKPQRRRKDVLLGAHVLGGEYIIKHRHALPKPDVLERPRDAKLCHHIRRGVYGMRVHILLGVFARVELLHLAARMICHDGLAVERDLPVRGVIDTRNAVERGGFAGSVGSDEGDDLTLINLQREVVDGDDAAELHGYVFEF